MTIIAGKGEFISINPGIRVVLVVVVVESIGGIVFRVIGF
jgi:hypothetical protein